MNPGAQPCAYRGGGDHDGTGRQDATAPRDQDLPKPVITNPHFADGIEGTRPRCRLTEDTDLA